MASTFLTGPAGTGKTTYAAAQLREWLARGVPANNILVLVPQLTLAQPYRDVLRDPHLPGTGAVELLTMNGLALKTIDLFWPLIVRPANFGRPDHPPIFLTIETAQYYLRQAIDPLLKQGYFDPNIVPITISLPRLMSQILDNLNKAALMGLPHTQVGERLAASIPPDSGSRVALEHTQACANRFREFCLARNLLDFSLRIDTFREHLWPVDGVRRFIEDRYRYLIVDNIEEDNPLTHAILRDWLPKTEQALIVNDEDAGYRVFLGANWRTAEKLAEAADETVRFDNSHVAPAAMLSFGRQAARILNVNSAVTTEADSITQKADPRRVMTFEQKRFYPQMIDWTVEQIDQLVGAGTPPGEIVVLAPFVSDALRFSFANKMERLGLTARSHRPSRPLSEESPAKTMLILARLAFPHWKMLPEPFDVAQALSQSIAGLDLIRASLLSQVVYRPYAKSGDGSQTEPILTSFDQIEGPIRERISYATGNRFDELRQWLQEQSGEPDDPPVLDHFFSRLFGEVLSQPGFGFHKQQEAGQIVANLIDSARQFRQVAEQVPLHVSQNGRGEAEFPAVDSLNRAYLETIEQGIAAAQYLRSWQEEPDDSVLITPATTFLMSNRPVDYQFWLDAGSSGWWERIAQPLTHPYVLTADYEAGRPWTDADEVAAQRDRLYRLVVGLSRRCRKHIFITNAEVGEQGYEQRGQLLIVLQQMLRQLQREEE